MSAPTTSRVPWYCAALTLIAITLGMLLEGRFDALAAALLFLPATLLLRALVAGFRRL